MQSINFDTARGSVDIREANLADAAKYRELRLYALQDSPTAFSADYQINLGAPMSFWEGRVKPDEHGVILFAEHENNLIGNMGIRTGESPKTKHSATVWGVHIRPEWRGLHIAGRLMEAGIEWAKMRRVEIVKLGVVTTNTSAVRCYERCGFSIYGTDPRGIFYEGKYYDEYLMSRNIA